MKLCNPSRVAALQPLKPREPGRADRVEGVGVCMHDTCYWVACEGWGLGRVLAVGSWLRCYWTLDVSRGLVAR